MRRRIRPFGVSGVALAETALVLSVALLFVFGALQVAILGFIQMTADTGSFLHAHGVSVGMSDAAARAQTTQVLSKVKTTDITSTAEAPPVQATPVNYGYSNTSNRHGGASFIAETQQQSEVTNQQAPFTNMLAGMVGPSGIFTTRGIDVEPLTYESSIDFNVYGDPNTGLLPHSEDYFTQGENAPPYFVGFHYVSYCTADPNTKWNQCPGGTPPYAALGMAEYLDADNWARTSAGVTANGVFRETANHQRVFADLATFFAANAAMDLAGNEAKAFDKAGGAPHADWCTTYNWDNHIPGGYPPNNVQPGQYPLSPDVTNPTCPGGVY